MSAYVGNKAGQQTELILTVSLCKYTKTEDTEIWSYMSVDTPSGCFRTADHDQYAILTCNATTMDEWHQARWDKQYSEHILIAGAVVGSVAGAVVILGVIWWCRRRKSKRMQGHGKAEEIELETPRR